jgi:hypothetical protein
MQDLRAESENCREKKKHPDWVSKDLNIGRVQTKLHLEKTNSDDIDEGISE